MTENISPTDSNRSSKRYGKAAIAGGIAVALLAGGGYTFARWYDQQQLPDTNISMGELKLTGSGGDCRLVLGDPVSKKMVIDNLITEYSLAENSDGTSLNEDKPLLAPDDYIVCQAADINGTTLTAKGKNLKWKLDTDLAGGGFTDGRYASITAPDPDDPGKTKTYTKAIELLGQESGGVFTPAIKVTPDIGAPAPAKGLEANTGSEGVYKGQVYYGFHISASSTEAGEHSYDASKADPAEQVNDKWWHKALQNGTATNLFNESYLTVKQING